MRSVMGMDSGNSCTKVGMYLTWLNCTVKMVKVVDFVLCILRTKKSTGKNQSQNIMREHITAWCCDVTTISRLLDLLTKQEIKIKAKKKS